MLLDTVSKKKHKPQVKRMNIYIDGSCRPSTKYGAYGILIVDDKGGRTTLTGTRDDVTNNIMELTAYIEALRHIIDKNLDADNEIEIFCDSQYVVKGIGEWYDKWKENGFKTASGDDVKNVDLWKHAMKLSKKVKAKLTWTKGHATNIRHNEIDRIVYDLTSRPQS